MKKNNTIKNILAVFFLMLCNNYAQDTTLTVTSSGNVGIGTTKPSEKLVVGIDLGEALSGNRITIGNDAGASALNLGTNIDNRAFLFWDYINNHLALGTRSAGLLYGQTLVLKDGKIGGGTAEPTEKLDIRGNIAVNGTVDGVDVSDLKSDFDSRISNYFEFSDLNYQPINVSFAWTKLNTSSGVHQFTKTHNDSKIEVYFNSLIEIGDGLVNENPTVFQVRVDDTVEPDFGNQDYSTRSYNTKVKALINAVFEDLAAGTHTVAIFAKVTGGLAANNVLVDPMDMDSKIIVKETW